MLILTMTHFLESFHKMDFKAEERGKDSGKELRVNHLKSSEPLTNIKEPNKNILSRLTDLSIDLEKKKDHRDKKGRIIEVENNNREESDDWLTGKPVIMNENEQKIQNLKHKLFSKADFGFDFENNTIEKYSDEVTLTKPTNKNENLKAADKPLSPKKLDPTHIAERDLLKDTPRSVNAKESIIWDDHANESITKPPTEFFRSKLMPEMDLQKVYYNLILLVEFKQ